MASEDKMLERDDERDVSNLSDNDESERELTNAKGDIQTHPPPSMIDVVNVLGKSLLAARDELVKIVPGSAEPGVASENAKETVVGEIQRLSMSDWVGKSFFGTPPSTVALKVYYRELPTSKTQTSEALPTNPGSEEYGVPHRIDIPSKWLVTELEEITNIPGNVPLLMKPPYKALIQFWPDIGERLSKLKAELLILESQETTEPDANSSRGNEAIEETPEGTRVNRPVYSEYGSPRNVDEQGLRWRVSHLETLYDFIKSELGDQLRLRAKVEDGTLEAISFKDLWQLFKPGDVLYSQENGFEQLYRGYAITGGQLRLRYRTPMEIESLTRRAEMRRSRPSSYMWDDQDGSGIEHPSSDSEDSKNPHSREAVVGIGTWSPLTIDCFNFGMDRTRIGAIDCYKRIHWYVGERKLTDLPIFPLRFLPNMDDALLRLEARGLKCVHCNGHKKYDGFAYDAKGRPSRDRFQGDVYIDFKEFYREKRRDIEPKLGTLLRTEPDRTEVEEELGRRNRKFRMDHEVDQRNSDVFLASHTEVQLLKSREQMIQSPEQLRLMCHQVIAFAFKFRKWVRLEIDYVDDIDKSAEARNSGFDDLVIFPKYRRLLVSLVDAHTSDTSRWKDIQPKDTRPLNQLDLVRGKGLGLVILLHGPPGTGKTSTAETIASYTGRPLYSITCGDLGDISFRVERSLEKHTTRADKWGCVLLLDEADVFLMRRDFKDTGRNALVSIFLRTLEYYSGILFLTTNRVGVIDEAFKSRVHIALRYPKVKLTTTLEIWKGCLDRMEKDNEFRDVKIEFDRIELMEFAEEHYQKHHKYGSTWNGRQIRNAFQTAISLGQYERTSKIKKKGLTDEEALASGKKKWRVVQLSKKNLETIAETAQDFDKYMKSVHKFPDDEIAKAEELRDDDFSESSEEEEFIVQKSSTTRRSLGRAKQPGPTSRKSGKSIATSSTPAAARSSHRLLGRNNTNSSEDNLSAEGAAQSSSNHDTDDDS